MRDGLADAGQQESRGLTGLRGLGALLVLLHHFYLHVWLGPAILLRVPFVWPILQKGYIGVDLFFVLSGFVIAMVYGPWFAAPPCPAGATGRTLVFWLRRWARLWPLHVVMLAVTIVPLAGDGGLHSINRFLANAAMIQAWGFSAEINSPAWSISTEWFAYLTVPLLAPALLRSRFGVIGGLVAIAALLATALLLAPHVGLTRRGPLDIYFNYSVLPIMRCLAGFMLGMIAWRLGRVPAVASLCGRAWFGIAALALMIGLMLGRVHDLVIYPLLPAIVLALHYGRGPAWRLFAHGPVYRLGVVSYAFYLVHFTLLSWFPFGWGPHWLELLAYLTETVAAAALLHVAVERPGRMAIRRWVEPMLMRVLGLGQAVPLRGGPG